MPHEQLLLKLRACGVHGKLLDWVEVFLKGLQQQVTEVNGSKLEWAEARSGVPQGTALGPLLFVVLINYLPGEVSSSIKMFSDDTTIFRSVGQTSDVHLL